MSRAVIVVVVVGALGVGLSAAHADSGTTHHCPIDGAGAVDVYLDTSGKDATLVVRGEEHEAKAKAGHFVVRADDRTYSFAPRWRTPPAELTITTANERRVVRCTGP